MGKVSLPCSEVVCLRRNREIGEALLVPGGWVLSFGIRVTCTLGLHDAEWGGVHPWFDLVYGSISIGRHSIPLSERLYCWQCFTYLGYVVLGFWCDFLGGRMGVWGVVLKAASLNMSTVRYLSTVR